nr:MAG TPA: hypothetical protein [Caudoviricetes sp.]
MPLVVGSAITPIMPSTVRIALTAVNSASCCTEGVTPKRESML